MRPFPFSTFLMILLYSLNSLAQDHICLKAGSTPGTIAYHADDVDKMLHFERYNSIIIGEMHNGSFNPEMYYHLLTQLNRDHGFQHIFLEMSASTAWHYNRYLSTGDTTYLSNKRMVANYGLWPDFWRRIFEYNEGRAVNQKMIIHGVDFEQTNVFATIMELAPEYKTPPPSISSAIDSVKKHLNDEPLKMYTIIKGKMIESDNSGFVTVLKYIQKTFLENPADTKSYFGANYNIVQEISENNGKVEVRPKHRNKTMFQAIKRAVQQQKIDKLVGIFGSGHTLYTKHTSISNTVRKLPGVDKNKVLHIQSLIYNLNYPNPDSSAARDLKKMNGDCKATLVPSSAVKGFLKKADYVIIGDAKK